MTAITEQMVEAGATGKRKRQMERTGAGNAFDPTMPPTKNELDDARACLTAALASTEDARIKALSLCTPAKTELQGMAQIIFSVIQHPDGLETIDWQIARALTEAGYALANKVAGEPVAWGRVLRGKAVTLSFEKTIANDEPLYATPTRR